MINERRSKNDKIILCFECYSERVCPNDMCWRHEKTFNKTFMKCFFTYLLQRVKASWNSNLIRYDSIAEPKLFMYYTNSISINTDYWPKHLTYRNVRVHNIMKYLCFKIIRQCSIFSKPHHFVNKNAGTDEMESGHQQCT